MRRLLRAACAHSAAMLALIALAEARNAGVILSMKGKVEIRRADTQKWVAAKAGDFLQEGDAVRTGRNSSAHLSLVNGSQMKLDAEASIACSVAPPTEPAAADWTLETGKIWNKVNAAAVRKYTIRTPVAIVAVRGTEFDMELGAGLAVRVFEGTVEVKNDLGSSEVKAGQKTEVAPASAPSPPVQMTPEEKEAAEEWKEAAGLKYKMKLALQPAPAISEAALPVSVEIVDAEGRPVPVPAKVRLTASPAGLLFSADKTKWAQTLEMPMRGRLEFFARAEVPGEFRISAASEQAEAATLDLTLKRPSRKTLRLMLQTPEGEREIRLRFRRP